MCGRIEGRRLKVLNKRSKRDLDGLMQWFLSPPLFPCRICTVEAGSRKPSGNLEIKLPTEQERRFCHLLFSSSLICRNKYLELFTALRCVISTAPVEIPRMDLCTLNGHEDKGLSKSLSLSFSSLSYFYFCICIVSLFSGSIPQWRSEWTPLPNYTQWTVEGWAVPESIQMKSGPFFPPHLVMFLF